MGRETRDEHTPLITCLKGVRKGYIYLHIKRYKQGEEGWLEKLMPKALNLDLSFLMSLLMYPLSLLVEEELYSLMILLQ